MGIRHIGYGDIFLEDLRKYREENLASRDFEGVFPLWKISTGHLAKEFIAAGFKTVICAADAELIPQDQVGRDFNLEFLDSLSSAVDPCGENGEFHSFCYDGPIFREPIAVSVEKILSQTYDVRLSNGEAGKKHFWFAEILPLKT